MTKKQLYADETHIYVVVAALYSSNSSCWDIMTWACHSPRRHFIH